MRIGKQTILIFLAVLTFHSFTSMAGSMRVKEKSEKILSHSEFFDLDEEQKSLNTFIENLAKRKDRYSNEENFIRYVFHRTHNKYLKHYLEQASIDQLFEKGYYDCLTGTALYLMIFEQLGYSYEVTEMDYHVYMTLSSGNETYMVESTDPFNGIRVSSSRIKERAFNDESQKVDYYRYTNPISNTINVEQLIGLLYFNQAVKSYNELQFKDAWDILQTAKIHYPSNRMDEFEFLILKEMNRQEIALTNL